MIKHLNDYQTDGTNVKIDFVYQFWEYVLSLSDLAYVTLVLEDQHVPSPAPPPLPFQSSYFIWLILKDYLIILF